MDGWVNGKFSTWLDHFRFAVVFQAAGVAVFGGFANRDYGASPSPSDHTYLGWCFWMTLVGGTLSLLSGIFFLFLDCCSYIDDEEFLKWSDGQRLGHEFFLKFYFFISPFFCELLLSLLRLFLSLLFLLFSFF